MANSDISKIKLPNNDELTIKDSQAVKAIERSGTTFTATRRDGTTFTFTQQDNNNAVTQTISSTDNNEYRVLLSGTADDATRTEGARKDTNFRYNPSTDNLIIGKINGSALGTAAYKNITDTYSATGTDAVSGKAVKAALDTLPEPMVFKGSLGTGGTITALPVDGSASIGDTYKVITDGTYASKAAKVGDTFICLTKTSSANTWELIPSGDEPSGTVTSVGISNGGGLSVSGSPITSSGTITISHADTSSQASVNNSGRTYIQDITLDTYGHVTGIASATETVVNTDRYVNSAAFAHDSTNDNVKMTLTRAGSDTATVTANIPKVSSSSSGVVPKGATVSSQSQTTKFLREDGTWAAPSYTTNTNTTYTLGTNGNTVTLTPSSGSAQSITVPYATTSGTANTAKAVLTAGGDVIMGTTGSDSDDSGDIVWRYGNGNEKARLYTANEYTAKSGLNYRVYKKDGTSLYSGTIPLADGTGASGTWDISVSGNAATATKLATARSIALGSDLQGSANFDGSGNITISASSYHCSVNGGNKANYPWHRIAYVTGVSGTYTDKDAIFVIRRGYNDGDFGIIKVSLRTNNTNTACNMSAKWIIRSGFAVNDIVIAQWGVTGNAVYADIFLRCSTYPRTTVYQIYGSRSWTLINSNEVNDTTTTDKKTSTEVYVTVESAATEIHNQAYTRTDDATDNGTVNYANSAGSATDNTKLPLAGGTMTGAITFANGVKNMVGDDSAIGDCNIAGTLGLIGANGATGLAFFLKDTTWGSSGNYAKFSYDGTSMGLNKPFNIQGTNGSWLTTGQSPTVYVKKSSGSGALGAYSIDTKTGRFVLSTYPSSDDLVYFNWFSDTTLAGTTNTVDKQFIWTPSTNTLSANISGTAAIANKLGSSNVGSATQPIYLSAGTATACTYTLGKSVPSNAVFTDTNTTYTLSADTTNNKIKLTPSSGNAQSITVPYASSAGSATEAAQVTISDGSNTTQENYIYYPVLYGNTSGTTSGTGTLKAVDGLRYHAVKGSTSVTGKSFLELGNDIATGTEGNKYGLIRIYAQSQAYSNLVMSSESTVGRTHTLPNTDGTISVFTATPTSGQVVISDGTYGGIKTSGYTIAKSVPSDAVFTDTNNKVTQTATTTSANYELLFSATADNTTRTEGARKTDSLKYNPSTKELTLNGTVVLNGYTRSTSTDPCPSIVLKANNIDTDTAVSARTYSNSEINVHDKDGDRLGFMNWFKDADGSIGFALSAQNKSAGGGNYYNTLEMRVDKTGNRAYSISDAKAFRTAINTTTCSFTKSISSLAGATIVRRGNVVTLEFGHQITSAGSYTNIGTVSPAPIETLHFVVNCGSSWQLARINTAGVVSFNNATSVAANAYLIGSCTYITAD